MVKRNYIREATKYYGYHLPPHAVSRTQKLHRKHKTARGAARQWMRRKHGNSRIKHIDIDHIDKNPLNNSPSNLRFMSVRLNRGKCAHHKCSK